MLPKASLVHVGFRAHWPFTSGPCPKIQNDDRCRLIGPVTACRIPHWLQFVEASPALRTLVPGNTARGLLAEFT